MVFFPRTPTLPILDDHTKQHTWRTAVTVALICLLHGFVTIIISVSLALARPNALGVWANILGITATILAAIQYLPQIWLTYNLGHIGSLSIPMMCIQTPGSFLWSGSLAARLGWGGWSTWGVFLVTGCLQGCLLALGISFVLKASREKRNSEAGAVSITSFGSNSFTNDEYSPMEDVSLDILQVHENTIQMTKAEQPLRVHHYYQSRVQHESHLVILLETLHLIR